MTGLLIGIGLLAIAALAVLAHGLRGGRESRAEVSEKLRQLLLDRASGAVSAEEFALQEAGLHARLLAPTAAGKLGKWHLVALGAFALGTVGLYFWLGRLASVEAPPPLPMASQAEQPGHAAADMGAAVDRLAARLEQTPDDGEGWELLARSYVELRRYPEAAKAFAKAAKLLPGDATLLADYADAQVMANERRWDAGALKTVQQALAADPKHLKALSLAGSEAFVRADYPTAVSYWDRLVQVAPPGSADAADAAANLQEARALLARGRPAAGSAAAPGAAIAGRVELAESLRAGADPEATIFVVAKAVEGGGPPLAVLRLQVRDLPANFRLDDSLAMMPGRNLSSVPEAMVQARLAVGGDALAKAGDRLSESVRAKPGAEGLLLVIGKP